MPQKEYEIAFKLAAQKNSQFSKAFSSAGTSVSRLEDRLSSLNAEASDVGELLKARKTVGENARAYVQAAERVAKLGKAMSQAETPSKEMTKAFKAAKTALDKAKGSLARSRAELKSLEQATGTSGQSIQTLAKRQKELAAATDEARKAQQKQAEIQAKIDKLASARSAIGKVNGGINAAGKAAGAAAVAHAGAVGGTVVGAGSALVKMGSDYQAAMNHFQASTGLTAKDMQEIEASARRLYTSGLGESFADVSNSMAIMRQTSGLTGKALEDATKNAMLLDKTFGMDVSESARASSALMKNFGIDGKKAYDLIAYAAQNGANKNGDLLDTLNEYAVQYKALGFTADEFTAHLVQGAKDGSFSIDKVGDSIKEFNIRAKEGSAASMEAFEMLGLNGTRATQMFAKGGQSAQLAFSEVIKRLKGIDDPVKRNAASVALFGTQMEDLQLKALDSFAAIKTSSIDASGTMSTIAELTTADLGNQITIIARRFQDTLAPASKETAKAMADQMPQISAAMGRLTPHIEKLGKAFTDMLPTIISWSSEIIEKAAEIAVYVAENFDKIASYVGFAVKAFLGLKIALSASNALMKLFEAGMTVRKMLIGVRAGAYAAAFATKAMAFASSAASGVMTTFSGAVRGVGAAMKFLAANPMVLVIGTLAALALAGNYIIKNWDSIKAKAVELYQSFKANLVDAMAPLLEQFQGIWTSIQGIFTGVVDFVKNVFTGQWSEAWQNAKDIFANVFNALTGIAKAPLNTVIALFNSAIKSMNQLGSFKVPDWVPGIGGESFSISLPEIPLLAKGGIATKPTLATIAEGGEAEAVIPLSRLSQMLDPMSEPPEDSSLSRASRALALSGPGVSTTNVSDPVTINFSPVINMQGGESAEATVRKALEECRMKLREEVQRMFDQDMRVAY